MNRLNEKLKQKLKENMFLIINHRGSHGGNIIENTSDSAIVSHKEGADIVEIDISMSTDGDFFVFHDGNEKRLLNEEHNINLLSSEEIRSKNYYNYLSKKTNKKVELFSEFLEKIPKNIFLNIDRSWFYWDKFLTYLDQFTNWHDQLIIKSPADEKLLNILNNHKVKYMYFPIVYNEKEIDLIEEFESINLVGLEIIEEDENNFQLINSKKIDKYKAGNHILLGNSIKLCDDINLFGTYDDDISILDTPNKGWKQLLDLGINAIQTDWAGLLNNYRENYKKRC